MSVSSCRLPPSPRPPNPATPPARSRCRPVPVTAKNSSSPPSLLAMDLSGRDLEARLKESGFSLHETVRPYAVTTVKIRQNAYEQLGSAPNFDGGMVTLCTCKHQMRGNYSAKGWEDGAWVVGLSSMSESPSGDQYLYFLMRVDRAYESHADLVADLKASGRHLTLDAKAATQHKLGDVLVPGQDKLIGAARFSPQAYHPPMLGHAHRQPGDLDYWHKDVDYQGRANRPPLLAGDPALSFVWTRPLVRRRRPAAIRDYENWTLARFISEFCQGAE